jgi:subtilisin family serine protease
LCWLFSPSWEPPLGYWNSEPAAATWSRPHLVQPRATSTSGSTTRGAGQRPSGASGIDIYVVDSRASEQAVANALSHHPHVKFAEVDRLVAPAFTPNDADYGSEWHLQTINAPIAWNSSVGSGVTVAILDSGIDPTHPDLLGQLVPGWNFYDNSSTRRTSTDTARWSPA